MLIVDDEPIIVEGLLQLFQEWQGAGLDVCRAYSGKEALMWMKRAKIDIVLTDIQMPGLNGIGLMEEIKRQWPDCQVIMFTGHSEFDYVYRSIRQEGVQYVLKSEGDETLLAAVSRCINEIRTKLWNEEWLAQAEHQMRDELPLLQKEFVLEQLHSPDPAEPPNEELLARLKIPLSSDQPLLLAACRLDPGHAPVSRETRTRELYILKQVLSTWLQDRFHYVMVPIRQHKWYILLQYLQQESSQGEGAIATNSECLLYLREALSTVQRSSEDTFGLSTSCVFYTESVAWTAVGSGFHELSWHLDYRARQETGVIAAVHPGKHDYSKRSVRDQLTQMEGYLLAHDLPGYLEAVSDLLGGEEAFSGKAHHLYAEQYYTTAIHLLQCIRNWGIEDKLAVLVDLPGLLKLDEKAAYSDISALFARTGKAIIQIQEDEETDRLERPILFVKTYIASHLEGDLSLVKLAELVHFNPSYLSRLFKRVTGENLSEYINRVKIARAIEWLEQPETKVQDAAASVGFLSVSYFNRVFKKLMGTTPQAYRESMMNKSKSD